MPTSSSPKSGNNGTERVVSTPGVCGGDWRIKGTRITLRVLAESRLLGSTDKDLLEDYPSLTKEDLAAAWAFSAEHPRTVRS
ncbi:MAG TPA: DUF433 domain-containing protein [Pirellulaceae bacterium]